MAHSANSADPPNVVPPLFYAPLHRTFDRLVPAFLLAFAAGPLGALLVLVVYAVIQGAESYLITPLIMERAASVHPATVIAVVTILGAAFGALGALLAVPTAVMTGVLINELWFQRLEAEDAHK